MVIVCIVIIVTWSYIVGLGDILLQWLMNIILLALSSLLLLLLFSFFLFYKWGNTTYLEFALDNDKNYVIMHTTLFNDGDSDLYLKIIL